MTELGCMCFSLRRWCGDGVVLGSIDILAKRPTSSVPKWRLLRGGARAADGAAVPSFQPCDETSRALVSCPPYKSLLGRPSLSEVLLEDVSLSPSSSEPAGCSSSTPTAPQLLELADANGACTWLACFADTFRDRLRCRGRRVLKLGPRGSSRWPLACDACDGHDEEAWLLASMIALVASIGLYIPLFTPPTIVRYEQPRSISLRMSGSRIPRPLQ